MRINKNDGIVVGPGGMITGGAKVERVGNVERQQNVTVQGQGNIVNVADLIAGVTNTVSQNVKEANIGPDVKELIKELMSRVAAIGAQVEPYVAQEMASNVKSLSEETTMAKPRPAWYQLSLKGLKEAAEAVGEVGKPVLESVLKLAPLLIPGSAL